MSGNNLLKQDSSCLYSILLCMAMLFGRLNISHICDFFYAIVLEVELLGKG